MSNLAIAEIYREADAIVNKDKEGGEDAPRVLVTCKRIQGLKGCVMYTDLEPFVLYPVLPRFVRVRGTGAEGERVTFGNVDSMIVRGKRIDITPAAACAGVLADYGANGDPERDWGARVVEPLTGCKDMKEIAKLQALMFPSDIVGGKPQGLHQRVAEHLQSVMLNNPVGSVEYEVAKICFESNEAARGMKIQHLRTRSAETSMPGGSAHLNTQEDVMRQEAGIEIPNGMQIAGALPGDHDYISNRGGGMSKEAEQALVSLATRLAEQSLSPQIEELVAAKAQELFEKFLSAQATKESRKTGK